jgi:hypothetical protein
MNYGEVGQILKIVDHPNADNLEIIKVITSDMAVQLVTGKHYREGDLGIWIPPGMRISGWLANDLWLVGKKRRSEEFEVREIEIRGVPSPGLWVGCWYRKDKSKESAIRASDHFYFFYFGTQVDSEGFIKWPWWDDSWKVGSVIVGLDIFDPSRGSSMKEQSVFNREVAGSNPAHGSQ